MVHADSLDGYLGHLKGTSHAFHIYICQKLVRVISVYAATLEKKPRNCSNSHQTTSLLIYAEAEIVKCRPNDPVCACSR